MMIVATEEFLIGDSFAVPIMYGDMTGLDEPDEESLDKWLEELGDNPLYKDCQMVLDFIGDTQEFAKCAITGLMSLCIKLRVDYLKGDQ